MLILILRMVLVEELFYASELSCRQSDGLLDAAHDTLHLLQVFVQVVRIGLLLVDVELQRLHTFYACLLVEIKEAFHFLACFMPELRVLVYQFVAFRFGNTLLLEKAEAILQSDQLLIGSFQEIRDCLLGEVVALDWMVQTGRQVLHHAVGRQDFVQHPVALRLESVNSRGETHCITWR
jgi:hypothetical protein